MHVRTGFLVVPAVLLVSGGALAGCGGNDRAAAQAHQRAAAKRAARVPIRAATGSIRRLYVLSRPGIQHASVRTTGSRTSGESGRTTRNNRACAGM